MSATKTTKTVVPLVVTPDAINHVENMLRDSVDRYDNAIQLAEKLMEQFDAGEIGTDIDDWKAFEVIDEALQMLVNEYEDRIKDLEEGIQEAQRARLAAKGQG